MLSNKKTIPNKCYQIYNLKSFFEISFRKRRQIISMIYFIECSKHDRSMRQSPNYTKLESRKYFRRSHLKAKFYFSRLR